MERTFGDDELIVSKTDIKGVITYANQVFQRVAGFTESELVGQPHNIIRHPEMPACVFKLLWDTIEAGNEIFAYVINQAKNGDHYWVFAHVTPTFDASGRIVSYHSSRRSPRREALPAVRDLYATLLAEEKRHASPKDGMAAALRLVNDLMNQNGTDYPHFVHTL
ncbi:transcriptional regulator [Pararhodospirillum oryzae]|uniref:Transcriptional regulator n=1 Tax=Pararhodospirillum oryzae TaxID=478448 RepID=A0A512H7K0_9PROT|nr:transcriptional regulator [Pararhodospirillum oryzae]